MVIFDDSLLESGYRFKSGRARVTRLISFTVQIIFLGILVLIPLIYTEALPTAQLMTILVAPPAPPPSPKPGEVVRVVKMVQTDMPNGVLRTPRKIPSKIEMIEEKEPPSAINASIGVPGGSGSMGPLNSIIGSMPIAMPKAATPPRMRVSEGVAAGQLLHKITPNYPPLARQARIQGSVVLEAVISRNGTIENLHLVQGHPMLAPAAIEAVKQWKYKPYLLNNEAVEVETLITVNFTLSGG